ncbi:hypothetical protein [Pseudomonas chlororaphis]|uniref:hypothetical protein n=1 Tax=Pseudomonas chlororaphis TaxID=587753 RepID=UPI002367BE50|nr:hypothetical protein [Pseudomonas chlororaphis]WDH33711.1 hypothetical protein PUP62_23170 [Pseudomonas chlororaphis]WDH39795.1 hypothetical protein PUP51_23170 [Pseudomonas chlororaphis]
MKEHNLAVQAATAGVQCFAFIASVKVSGEEPPLELCILRTRWAKNNPSTIFSRSDEGGSATFWQVEIDWLFSSSREIDIKKSHDLLSWTPPLSIDDALLEIAKHYLGTRNL